MTTPTIKAKNSKLKLLKSGKCPACGKKLKNIRGLRSHVAAAVFWDDGNEKEHKFLIYRLRSIPNTPPMTPTIKGKGKKVKTAWAVVTKRGTPCGYSPYEIYENKMDALDVLDSFRSMSKSVAAWEVKKVKIIY